MKHKTGLSLRRRLACMGLTAVMASTFVVGQLLALSDGRREVASADESYNLDFENANGKADLSKIKIDNLNKQVVDNSATSSVSNVSENTVGTVIVTLSAKSLSERTFKSDSAKRDIENEQSDFLSSLSAKGVTYSVRSTYSSVLNGVALDMKLSDAKQIKGMYGVKSVTVSPTYAAPKTAEGAGSNLDFSNITDGSIYSNGIYNSTYNNVSKGYDGTGMKVAILDTGLDYTHPAFDASHMENSAADGYFTKTEIADMMQDGHFKATLRTGATVDDVYISPKVPFAYDYADSDADVYPSYSQHGTHVAGIVGGKNKDGYTDKNGETAKDENGKILPFYGVAPETQLVICKVFSDDLENPQIGGAEATSIVDALEDCYNLNVDVINMSLGTSCGFPSSALGYDDEGRMMQNIYANLRNKGISLMIAASNDFSAGYGGNFGTNLTSNPDSGTVGSPSTFSGAMSIASINGQLSPYFIANAGEEDEAAIFYEESRNEDSEAYDFLEDILKLKADKDGKIPDKATIKYVSAGRGDSADLSLVEDQFKNKKEGEVVVAVVSRGGNTFKDKVSAAKSRGADGVIVYNNVAGMVRMSLGDLSPHVPAISISLEEGLKLVGSGSNRRSSGTLTFDRTYLAGPFMNDYSSWGVTPDLQLKPDVTSHGGEITSTVAGGYEEMSGTSMACPNLAGFTALIRSYLEKEKQSLWYNTSATADENAVALTHLTNNIIMSTATIVYDNSALPYSPRKQGSGLATLKNVFNTGAYLYTAESDNMCEDGRPKAELKDDPKKTGVKTVKFHVKNFGETDLVFKANSILMTETIGPDNKAVAEKARYLSGAAEWKVNGAAVAEGGNITVAQGEDKTIEVKLTLSDDDKKYLEKFVNGMFVEGFLKLESAVSGQCDLSLPFMGFYGDWKDAPMMDRDCFEVAATEKLSEENRIQPSIWATQPYGYYANEKYTIPLGSFLYLQDPAKEHTADYVYVEEEHIAISHDFGEYYGEGDSRNYYTTSGIKALYAGLLRNAEVVTYTLTNVDTGEILPDANGNEVREVYRVGKSYAAGGSPVPAQVLLELKTEEMGVQANGKYRLDFRFYFSYDDYKNGTLTNSDGETYGVYKDNVFSMNFYVDYEAPILQESRITFRDRQDENNKELPRQVNLELDIFDNHYPQAVVLCYSEKEGDDADVRTIKLATDYIVPILNPVRNSTTTVSIDITEFYEKYGGGLWVELDDYALNSNLYYVYLDNAQTAVTCPQDFKVTYNGEAITAITVNKNEPVKLSVDNLGDANLANFTWSTVGNTARVKNGELVGLRAGTTTLTVTGGNGKSVLVNVTVTDNESSFTPDLLKNIYFNTILNSENTPVATTNIYGSGTTVDVNPGQKFKLEISADPWYYPLNSADSKVRPTLVWRSTDETVATVDQEGNVEVLYEDPDYTKEVRITATVVYNEREICQADVNLNVILPYKTTSGTLTKYTGRGVTFDADGNLLKSKEGYNVLVIPKDMSFMTIGEEAFKDNKNVEVIVFPKSVSTIESRAFEGCTNLKKICFISEDKIEPADSSLSMIRSDAFKDCASFETLDLSNCKVITIDKFALSGCVNLKEVKKPKAIGTVYVGTFAGCTSLTEIDLSDLHVVAGYSQYSYVGLSEYVTGAFEGCTKLTKVTTGKTTALGENMFKGCTSLEEIVINCPVIPDGAFEDCTKLKKVTITAAGTKIGARAFANCSALTDFIIKTDGGYSASVASLGDGAFSMCTQLKNNTFAAESFKAELGADVFNGVSSMNGGMVRDGKVLYLAPAVADQTVLNGIEEIKANAFSRSTVPNGTALDLSNVKKIGEGAFAGLSGLSEVRLPENMTEIPARLFYGCTGLKTVTMPATVTKIGDYAFCGCSAYKADFSGLTALKEIGEGAFADSGVINAELGESVTEIGDEAFARCSFLTNVSIAAVEKMGTAAFSFTPRLKTVSFGAKVKTTGEYTFTSWRQVGEVEMTGDTVLDTVTFATRSDKIKLGDGTFAHCKALKNIDLGWFNEIGVDAFYNCEALATVMGLNGIEAIGDRAFFNCAALTAVDLTAAKTIGIRAFFSAEELASVTLGSSLKSIEREAFSECALTSVTIPAGCAYVGTSAFAGNLPLKSYAVEEGNQTYVAFDGVLYRYVTPTSYELIAYPTGKVSQTEEGGSTRTFTIKDGTVAVHDWAFYYSGKVAPADVPADSRVRKVVLPHTVKTLGDGAFYQSGITEYDFEGVIAPVLLESIRDRVLDRETVAFSNNSFFYNNFNVYLADVTKRYPTDTDRTSPLKITYPKNGVGYDNFVYSNYFGTKVSLEERPTEESYELKALLESFAGDLADIPNWATAKDKAFVEAYSQKVISAHILYNGLESDYQKEFVGKTNIDTLFAVEAALKPVKAAHGIRVGVREIAVDESSSHKKEYKVGEKFSISGIKLLVTYDDYSQEVIQAEGNFNVTSSVAGRGLRVSDKMIELIGTGNFAGSTARIPVNVTEGAADDGNGGGRKLSTTAIALIAVGCALVVLAAGAAVVLVLIKKKVIVIKKKNKSGAAEADGGQVAEATDGKSETAEEAATENATDGGQPDGSETQDDNGEATDKTDGGEEGTTDD